MFQKNASKFAICYENAWIFILILGNYYFPLYQGIGIYTIEISIKLKTTVNDVLDTEICYVCVPTPESDSGQCDVSIVKTVVKELVDNKYFK